MKYRRKNIVEIEAVQWTGTDESYQEICALASDIQIERLDNNKLVIPTFSKQGRVVLLGEYIIGGRECYPHNPESFLAEYEPVPEE